MNPTPPVTPNGVQRKCTPRTLPHPTHAFVYVDDTMISYTDGSTLLLGHQGTRSITAAETEALIQSLKNLPPGVIDPILRSVEPRGGNPDSDDDMTGLMDATSPVTAMMTCQTSWTATGASSAPSDNIMDIVDKVKSKQASYFKSNTVLHHGTASKCSHQQVISF